MCEGLSPNAVECKGEATVPQSRRLTMKLKASSPVEKKSTVMFLD
jgi:hypothetical protein